MPFFKKRSAAKGGGTSSAKRGGSGPPLPLPFPVPEEVQWLLRQWDLEAVIGRSIALYKRFWSLPRETQSLLSWGFLLFTVFFISGFWTLKLALLAILLLFRPFESPEKRKERLAMAAAGKKGRAGKSTSARRGKVDQGFSDDPLISALQRIPETFTFGNIPPSATGSPAATPSRKVSSATTSLPSQQAALPRSHPHRQSVDAGVPAGSPLAQPPRYRPRVVDEPIQYDSSSSTDSRSSNPMRSRAPGLGLGPAPRRPQGMPIRSDRAVTAPLQQQAYRAASTGAPALPPPSAFSPASTSTSTSGQFRAPLTPMLAQQQQQFSRHPSTRREESLQEEEPPLSVWEQQQRDVDLYKTGEARHKSASFHRLEQAQKFWNRKFSSSSHRAGEGDGEGYEEGGVPAAEVVAAVQ